MKVTHPLVTRSLTAATVEECISAEDAKTVLCIMSANKEAQSEAQIQFTNRVMP